MNDKSNKRASFIGGKFRSLRSLVAPSGKTNNIGSHNINTSTTAALTNSNHTTTTTTTNHHNEAPSSMTPTKTKRKVRTGNSKRNLNVMSELDDIRSPSVKAQQQQQFQRQLSHKQFSVAASTKASSSSKPSVAPAAPSLSSGQEMRQRLLEIEEMIARGKEEMGMLQGAEAIKIQTVARGFLQRRRFEKNKRATATATLSPMANRKQVAAAKKERKRGPNKIISRDATRSAATPPPATTAAKKVPRKELRAASVVKMQALVRGYLARRRQPPPKTLPNKKSNLNRKTSNHNNASAKGPNKTKLEKKTSEGSTAIPPDRYAWDADKNSPDNNDHYAWEQSAPNSKVAAQNTKRGSKPTSASGRGKAKRAIGGKNKDPSMKDRSMRDYSMKEESIPFHELVMEDTSKKESSGSMELDQVGVSSNVFPVVVEDEEVFEDVNDDSDNPPSSQRSSVRSQQSFQTSVASTFLSKLTEDDDDVDDGLDFVSVTSNEGDKEHEDLLSLSVMATAPKRHSPLELMTFGTKQASDTPKQSRRRQDDRRGKSSNKMQQQEEELSVSVMALSSRRDENGSESGSEQEEVEEDYSEDSRASYAYAPRYNGKTKNHKRSRHNRQMDADDDLSVSVMAVAEVSDLEGESEYECEDEESEYEDYDDDEEDVSDEEDDDLSDSVMAVALPGDSYFAGEDNDNDDYSVVHNAREDDMSITSVETDLPRESSRHHRRRRRRREEYDEIDDDDVIEAEDVSVLTTASNKRRKKNHHQHNNNRKRDNKQTQKKKTATLNKAYGNQKLLGQFQSDSSEEETSNQDRKRRQRRSRRSFTSKKSSHKKKVAQNDLPAEEELQRKLAEVNRLIEESRKEMERLMEEEATKIQAFVRMHQERKTMDSSRCTYRSIRHALSRTGTKAMNSAATTIQSCLRGYQTRALVEKQRRSRKRTRKNRKPAQGDQQEQQRRDVEEQMAAAEQETKLKKILQEQEAEMQRCKAALEAQKAAKLQALIRGSLLRSKDLLNPERVAAIKIQRIVRSVLRVVQLRVKLKTIAMEKENQLQMVQERKLKTIEEFEPGKFDNMDTRVKMVNFLKKQIEKENEATEKLVAKIKTVKENNVRLMSDNSNNVCTLTRLELDVESREEKKNALLKLNQEWVDGIKEYQSRVEAVNRDIKMNLWQRDVNKEYCKRVVSLVESRSTHKKLVKEVKFLADHIEVAGGSTQVEILE